MHVYFFFCFFFRHTALKLAEPTAGSSVPLFPLFSPHGEPNDRKQNTRPNVFTFSENTPIDCTPAGSSISLGRVRWPRCFMLSAPFASVGPSANPSRGLKHCGTSQSCHLWLIFQMLPSSPRRTTRPCGYLGYSFRPHARWSCLARTICQYRSVDSRAVLIPIPKFHTQIAPHHHGNLHRRPGPKSVGRATWIQDSSLFTSSGCPKDLHNVKETFGVSNIM